METRGVERDWPLPKDGQARVTILGSIHLANPENDEYNIEVDDPLTPRRQSELETVAAHLAEAGFESVAVEIPIERQTGLDDQYHAIRDGVAFDDETGFPDGPASLRSELVQIGFRVATRLDHDTVYAVDSHPPTPDIDADFAIDIDPEAVPYPVPDFEGLVEDEQNRLSDATLLEVFREKNTASELETLQAGNITASLSSSEADDYVGSTQIAFWYERNARMLENLIEVSTPGTDTLFVVGASHVLPIKQLATAAPHTCPQSPLPLLDTD